MFSWSLGGVQDGPLFACFPAVLAILAIQLPICIALNELSHTDSRSAVSRRGQSSWGSTHCTTNDLDAYATALPEQSFSYSSVGFKVISKTPYSSKLVAPSKTSVTSLFPGVSELAELGSTQTPSPTNISTQSTNTSFIFVKPSICSLTTLSIR